jgi:uncharacterized membrane protein YfcA
MGEIASYFARETYIKRRLSLLVLVGTALLVPAVLASASGRISRLALESAYALFTACMAVAVVFIVRGARAKFPRSANDIDEPLDPATQKKLRRRIRFLQCAAGFYAVALGYGLAHGRRGTWLQVLIGAAVNLLLEIALIKAIHRLRKKLKQAASPAAAVHLR